MVGQKASDDSYNNLERNFQAEPHHATSLRTT
jgi:hypothetical protein